MENLRWILIFAGVAILVLLYLSGRQTNNGRRTELDDSLDDGMPPQGYDGSGRDGGLDTSDPLMRGRNEYSEQSDDFGSDAGFDEPLERPGGTRASGSRGRVTKSNRAPGIAGGLSSTFDSLKQGITGNNSKPKQTRAAPAKQAKPPTKIVTLHVVAPEGQLMNGALLLEQFEQRGYHYGDMNIFHSIHEGKTVFSIAKLVVPGTFDIKDMDSFQTPGISLILQLPGPIPADIAFDVLLSEAHEIAVAMGATVLDADRSTLSNQTVQHMQEGIHEYMHKQKYFNTVPS